MTEPTDLERLLRAFVNIRDKRSELKKHFDAADKDLREKQDMIQAKLLMIMKETGTSQLKVPGVATAVGVDKTYLRAGDWEALWKFIEQEGRLDFLQRRLATRAIQTYMDENGGQTPPGVSMSVEKTVSVRRNT